MKPRNQYIALWLIWLTVLTACNQHEVVVEKPTRMSIAELPTSDSTVAAPTLVPAVTFSPTAVATQSPTSIRPTNTLPPVIETPTPTSTLTLPETSAEPQVLSLAVTPMEVDPGDTVTIIWEAKGDRATICPATNLFVLFTGDDCREVSVSGTMVFTIPPETGILHSPIRFTLEVKSGSLASASDVVSVKLKCHTLWFFADEWSVQGCPQEAIRSHAAVQYFERGKMIWIEQSGHYIILDEALMFEGEIRKQDHHIYDPLDIIQNTSGDIEPPEGFYAPESGFGLVWRGDVKNSPGYRASLGWAVAPEFGYETIYQCTEGYVSGGIVWQSCYLKTPDNEVVFFHPLGGWYLLSER